MHGGSGSRMTGDLFGFCNARQQKCLRVDTMCKLRFFPKDLERSEQQSEALGRRTIVQHCEGALV